MDAATRTQLRYAVSRTIVTGTQLPIEELVDQLVTKRDTAWTRALGIPDKTLTPEKCAEWLAADRVARARNVADAARPKGAPKHY